MCAAAGRCDRRTLEHPHLHGGPVAGCSEPGGYSLGRPEDPGPRPTRQLPTSAPMGEQWGAQRITASTSQLALQPSKLFWLPSSQPSSVSRSPSPQKGPSAQSGRQPP